MKKPKRTIYVCKACGKPNRLATPVQCPKCGQCAGFQRSSRPAAPLDGWTPNLQR